MKEREPLPIVHASAIERAAAGQQWLIDGLWGAQAVGIVGGNPKSFKTWLALDLALSVASGTPALGTYAVPRAGPVLLFAAEDPPATVRSRLEGVAASRGLDLAALPIHVVLASSLRLDEADDQARLSDAVDLYRPLLLVLDPFVRLHRIDENSAREVSGVLAYLRDLQRSRGVAVLVVHHARKAGAGAAQAGLSLRGSGDFYAWGDELLHMRRRRTTLELVVEHRSAPAPEPVQLELCADDERPHLVVVPTTSPAASEAASLREQVHAAIVAAGAPLTTEAVRETVRVRWQRASEVLRELEREGRIDQTPSGWVASATRRSSA
ncbi:MAG: AAA family ATPase [Planctomycetes bacterium]|nr:AAA family ATPase [Planctomycetota bacterium]MCO5170150.1 AAA family ATPase [Planctomycetota bacterium]